MSFRYMVTQDVILMIFLATTEFSVFVSIVDKVALSICHPHKAPDGMDGIGRTVTVHMVKSKRDLVLAP